MHKGQVNTAAVSLMLGWRCNGQRGARHWRKSAAADIHSYQILIVSFINDRAADDTVGEAARDKEFLVSVLHYSKVNTGRPRLQIQRGCSRSEKDTTRATQRRQERKTKDRKKEGGCALSCVSRSESEYGSTECVCECECVYQPVAKPQHS